MHCGNCKGESSSFHCKGHVLIYFVVVCLFVCLFGLILILHCGVLRTTVAPDCSSDTDEAPTRDVPFPIDSADTPQSSPRKTGVAYISETLIRRVTREDNLAQITTLHITLGKDLNKKIKVRGILFLR